MVAATMPSRTSSRSSSVTLGRSGAIRCICPAGVHGKPCWHMRAVATGRGAVGSRGSQRALGPVVR